MLIECSDKDRYLHTLLAYGDGRTGAIFTCDWKMPAAMLKDGSAFVLFREVSELFINNQTDKFWTVQLSQFLLYK